MTISIRSFRFFLLYFSLFTFAITAYTQPVIGMSTYWDDSFEEWIIMTEDERIEGQLRPRWLNRNDWTQWEWSLGDIDVTIRQIWKNDPTQWEIEGYDGDVVTCRAMWKGDLSEWKITNNSTTITLRPRWTNNANEWGIREKNYGHFVIYTYHENDPRDWVIESELDERISPNMQIALIFISLYHSVPKI